MWIMRIRRQEEFKILLCNPSGGNLLRQSCQTPTMELLLKNTQQPKLVDCFCKETPQQNFNQILNADPTRGVVHVGCGWNVSKWNSLPQASVQGSGWGSIRKSISYKKSYFWWYGNPTCGDSTGSNQIAKDQTDILDLLDLFEGRGEKG